MVKKRRFTNHFHATLIPTMILENEREKNATSYLRICPEKKYFSQKIFDTILELIDERKCHLHQDQD